MTGRRPPGLPHGVREAAMAAQPAPAAPDPRGPASGAGRADLAPRADRRIAGASTIRAPLSAEGGR